MKNKTFASDRKIYDTYVSTHFGKINKNVQQSFQSRYYLWKSYLKHVLPQNKNSKILEIGCGMGHNLYAFKKFGYTDIMGFDISKECIHFCEGLHFNVIWSPSIRLLKGNNRFKKKFDFIVLYDLLEHLELPEGLQLLTDIKTLLVDDGKVFISLPNGEFPFNMPQRYIDVTHKTLYTPSSLMQFLRMSGMKDIVLGSIPSITIEDDSVWKYFLKRIIFYPISEFSFGLLKLFCLTLGIFLKNFHPQLYCLAKIQE